MIDDVEVCEDEDALQQLKKSVNSSYSLLTSMVQHVRTTSTLSAAIPKGSAHETKKLRSRNVSFPPNERQRREISGWKNQPRKK